MSQVPVKLAQQPTPSWPYMPTRDDVMVEWQYQKAINEYLVEWLIQYNCTGCEEDHSTGQVHLPGCPEPERLVLLGRK